MRHLERHIAILFLQLHRETTKTWQLTKPILSKSLDSIKHKLAHINHITTHKQVNKAQQSQEPPMATVVIDDDEPVGPRRPSLL